MKTLSLNPSLTDSFTKALSYYRTVAGKKNREIAAAIGVPETTFSSWSNGKHLPDMDKLQNLANYLNAPIGQFFHFELPVNDPLQDQILQNLSKLSEEDKEIIRIVTSRLTK